MLAVCLVIYLAADVDLPVVAWDKAAPGFNVRRSKRKRVRESLETTCVYEIGAHTGCACGFLSDGNESGDEEKTAESRAALRSYVEHAVQASRVELLVCWTGDEEEEATALALSAEDLELADFDSAWDQPMRITVYAQALPAHQ